MRIDVTTLSDLEILDSESGPGILDHIDRTVTKAGRIALEARLKNPGSDVDAIRATQDAVRFFHGLPGLFLFDASDIDAVGRYMQSNIVIESRTDLGARVEKFWLSVSHRDLLREIGAGIDATRRFFTAVARTCGVIESHRPPTLLKDLVDRLQGIATAVLAICATHSCG